MVSVLFLIGLLAAVFVGFNIGGSSTGVAWGPSVGAKVINKTAAAALMTFFVFFGGWTVGRNVIDTLGSEIVPETAFSIEASIVVLSFIGLGMLFANIYGVPVSTSMTAVGAIAGLGLATNSLNWAVMGEIVVWWIIAPIIGFWCGAVIGRYLYPHLDRLFAIQQTEGPLITYDSSGMVPRPVLGPGTTPRELVSTTLVFLIACYMSFSAGASNIANAVAPLVGGDLLGPDWAVGLGTIAIGIGAFTIARRTMESVGNGLTDLPLMAATIVMVVAATITTVASWLGIPISLALSTVMTIVGLGWGRATRTTTVPDLARGEIEGSVSVNAVTVETDKEVPEIGEESAEDLQDAGELFDPSAVVRFVSFWIIGPSVATGLSYLSFVVLPIT
ncbi:phosphate transporter [Natrinema pellirubrum DSM 15624]|uniref:Phosphate transporter n=1 Tax=Natrinema pellirubrum (strain DSM 15624 / CIP 106293 / JCM 10476 / NCIMB 786 / 157) TaxID=797303 RepID=L0JR45_NATP1|nr:inorganic phosphate transporter [Natrinema pellirubrum]AGB33990.1 phosphate/sulfate permease [Natrinema pellirubrum DSM 15624]ELY69175.1 phosphate transporter [Natrinema pellirubrum DSM 15624]